MEESGIHTVLENSMSFDRNSSLLFAQKGESNSLRESTTLRWRFGSSGELVQAAQLRFDVWERET